MPKHIKELTTSDVVGALIRQESSDDRLADLKAYLYQAQPHLYEEQYEAEEQILLPEFATEELSQDDLLTLHFRRNNYHNSSIVNYESLLSSVDTKMQKIINSYGSSFDSSNQIIAELIDQLGRTSSYLTVERQPLKAISSHIRDRYLRICRKLRKVKNMEKTLDVMRFWNSSNISQVLRIKPAQITEYTDLEQLFGRFQEIVEGLEQRKGQFANYGNLVALIGERKKAIVQQVGVNAQNCIVDYENQQRLATILQQYEYISKLNQTYSQQSIFSPKHLPQLIQSNVNYLYQQALHRTKSSELSQQASLLAFYSEIFSLWGRYFSNWHQVTTFHVQQQTPYKQNFIQLRTNVFQKMLEKVEQSLKYNSRVDGLSLGKLMDLFKSIDKFMTKGEQWMGKCKSRLPQLLTEKYQFEVSQYFKIKNGQLKRVLFDELAVSAYQKEQYRYLSDSQLLQAKLTIRQELLQTISQKQNNPKDTHSNRFISSNNIKEQIHTEPLTRQQAVQDMNIYLQRLNSHLGLTLFKIMVEYQLRQEEVPQSNQLAQLQHHFQYLIVLIYKMCIPNYMKKQLQNQIFDEAKRHIKQSTIKTSLLRNSIDEQILTSINELRHLFLDRNTFGQLHDFLKQAQPKYQGVSLNSYLNVNLYYQEYEKYQGQINTLSEIFLNLMHELYLLNQYLHKIIEKHNKGKMSFSLPNYSNIVASLVLFYFTTYFECYLQRFYTQVGPLFLSTKFQVKKLHEFKGSLKQYKNRISELFNRLNVQKFSRQTCFNDLLVGKQTQYLYKFMIDLFSRIQKINDNGRQILKQEVSQLAKIIRVQGSDGQDEWHSWLMLYLELSRERSQKVILDKAGNLVIRFPIQWWRSSLLWFWGDCSSKQRKEFSHKLVTVYLNKLVSLPHI